MASIPAAAFGIGLIFNAGRIRRLIELLIKLKLRAVAGHEPWYVLDWLRVIYEDKRDELWLEPTAEWIGPWQPQIAGPDARLALRAHAAATLWAVRRSKWLALVSLWG